MVHPDRMVLPEQVIASFTDPLCSVYVEEMGPGSPLACTVDEHKEPWTCWHVQGVIKENLDAEQLWDRGFSYARDFWIPVMPSAGILKLVTIDDMDSPDMKTVSWSPDNAEQEGVSFLGFISRGEGRMAIRQMLLNEYDMILGSITKCTSNGHGLVAEKEWKKAQLSTKSWWLTRFNVIRYGMCTFCRVASTTRLHDDEDLIPDSAASDAVPFWKNAGLAKQRNEARARERVDKHGKATQGASNLLAQIKKEKEQANADDERNRNARVNLGKNFVPQFSVPSPKDQATDDLFDS